MNRREIDTELETLLDVPTPATDFSSTAQRLTTGLRPARPLLPAFVYAAVLTILFAAIGCAAGWMVIPYNWNFSPALKMSIILYALGGSAASIAYVLTREMSPGLSYPFPRAIFLTFAALLPLATLGFLFDAYRQDAFWPRNWACFRFGSIVALPAALLFLLVIRRGAFLAPSIAALATGLFAGLTGTLALEIHCPNPDVRHILLSHYGVAVAGAILGFGIARIGSNIHLKAR